MITQWFNVSFFIVWSIIVIYTLNDSSPPLCLPSLSHRCENGRVFFGVVTIAKSKRRYLIWDEWMYRLNMQGHHHAMFLEKPAKDYPNYYIDTNQTLMNLPKHARTRPDDRDRMSKRVTGAQFMMKHKEYDWYWSLTDDVMIDTSELDNYMCELSNSYNPTKDFVIRGHYLEIAGLKFLQGGSGFIFSKYATEKFVEKSEQWIYNQTCHDDIMMEQFFLSLGLQPIIASSNRMYGVGLIFEPEKAINTPELLPNCSLIEEQGSETTPISKVVAFHPNKRLRKDMWLQILMAKDRQPKLKHYFNHTENLTIQFCYDNA